MYCVINRIATTNNNSGGDRLYTQTEMTGDERSGTLSFRDGSTQWKTSMVESYDSTRDVTYHEDVPLSEFFARPVKLFSYTWSTSDVSPFYRQFDPWTLFLNNVRVANRMSNYQNFSANLHVKIVINGNSFLYGRLMADYAPLSAATYDRISDYSGTTAAQIVNCIQASQRLHIFVDPSESQAGELELPFLWPYDKVNLVTGEFSSLGNMFIRQLQPLKHANGAVQSVNINVFAWATNVKLSIPTTQDIVGITPQSGKFDEYGSGPISGMASAVASGMGTLSSVPYIGRYARATSMIAGAMGKAAALFGYSRPPVIGDTVDMKPSLISRIANFNGGDNVAKLSLDAKQELTIDPSVMGLSGVDEMSIAYLASKESYITQFPWTVARVPNDCIFSARVGPPNIYVATQYYIPAVTYASLPFDYWRGSMKYRFQIVASGYHKGRLLIVWDPFANFAGPETNVQYSKIVDLANERDFTFEVGWGSNAAWLSNPGLSTSSSFQNTGVIGTGSQNYNGVVSVYVLNELTTPNSTVNNDININVFVSGCADFKVAVPSPARIQGLGDRLSLTPQSGTFEEVETENKNAPRNEDSKETIAMCEPLVDATDSVYFGETIVSMRQILKRYNYWGSLYGVANAASSVQQLFMPDFPPNRGYSLYGAVLNTANNYNPSNFTVMNYLSIAYVGYRGGVRHKVVVNTSNSDGNLSAAVNREIGLGTWGAIFASAIADIVTTQMAFAKQRLNSQWPNTYRGAHLTTTKQQPTLEFEVPFYRPYRFGLTRNMGRKGPFSADEGSHIVSVSTPANATTWYDIYVAGAEDSTFMCFQGCPPLLQYTVA